MHDKQWDGMTVDSSYDSKTIYYNSWTIAIGYLVLRLHRACMIFDSYWQYSIVCNNNDTGRTSYT